MPGPVKLSRGRGFPLVIVGTPFAVLFFLLSFESFARLDFCQEASAPLQSSEPVAIGSIVFTWLALGLSLSVGNFTAVAPGLAGPAQSPSSLSRTWAYHWRNFAI